VYTYNYTNVCKYIHYVYMGNSDTLSRVLYFHKYYLFIYLGNQFAYFLSFQILFLFHLHLKCFGILLKHLRM